MLSGVDDEEADEPEPTVIEPAEPLNQRLRRAFLEGAEQHSQRRLGRPLTPEELERVLGRYPGDV